MMKPGSTMCEPDEEGWQDGGDCHIESIDLEGICVCTRKVDTWFDV